MVVLAAAVTTKTGKTLLSRQFVPLSKVRIEGLLAAFPKLIGSEKQHTFVETENIRYVYQPLESLYVLLVTNKTSNILEDLETLHLMAKIVPEFCRNLDEIDVLKNAFEIIFAFDEAIAMGYKERVDIRLIKEFTAMRSDDEARALEEEKEKLRRAAQQRKKVRQELERKRMEERKYGYSLDTGRSMTNSPKFGQQVFSSEPIVETKRESPKPAPKLGGKGLQLGAGKKTGGYSQILKEENVPDVVETSIPGENAPVQVSPTHEKVHIVISEKLNLVAENDGGLQNLEVKGELVITVYDETLTKIDVHTKQGSEEGFQFKTHPNINKNLYSSEKVLALKDSNKSYPVGAPTGILKWRFTSRDESNIPLTINVWPSTSGGETIVPIEYEKTVDYDLQNVVIAIPIPGPAPVVGEIATGSYDVDTKKGLLFWTIPLIDASSASGSMEFTVPAAKNEQFFPVEVEFTSNQTMCPIQVESVTTNGNVIDFSQEVNLTTESYRIQ